MHLKILSSYEENGNHLGTSWRLGDGSLEKIQCHCIHKIISLLNKSNLPNNLRLLTINFMHDQHNKIKIDNISNL